MIGGDQSGSELIGEGGGDQSDRSGSEVIGEDRRGWWLVMRCSRMLSDRLRYFLALSLSILSNFVTFVVTIEASKKMSALLSTKLLYLIYYTAYVTTDTR